MKNLTLKNRPSTLTPLLVGLALGAVASLPSVAHAQVKESWELGADAAKWRTSSSTASNTYSTPGQPIVVRSSVADDGPGAACAGKYVRETNGVSGGRVFGIGANVMAVTAGQQYCLSAWTRAAAGGQPFIGVVYTGAAGLVSPTSSTDTECWLLSSGGFTNGGGACNGVAAEPITNDTQWRWTGKTFTVPAGRTHAQIKFVNFCGSGGCGVSDGSLPPVDFDDIQLTMGACGGTPPADTASHTACAGNTPVCAGGDAANNAKCMDCNGNNGQAGATRPCPTAAAPICETAGANKGSCSVACTGDFGSAGASPCTVNTPFCVDVAGSAFKTCKACAGNDGSGMMPACPPANPTCFTTGAKSGSCGRCTAAADCGGTTPRCDVGTGRCTDDCDTDADCGGKTSGKICDAGTLKCKAGCRGDTSVGNGCPAGEKCSSVDLKPGTCTPIPVPDAGADSGKPDAGPPPVDASVPDSSPVTPPDPGADSGAPVDPGATPPAADDPGGCAATPASTLGSSAALSMVLGLFIGAVARRRRRDGARP